MSLKSFFKKIVPGTKTPPPPKIEEEEAVRHEMSFEKLETKIDKIGPINEIDVYVNDEKTNIYQIGDVSRIGRDPAQSDIIISELIVSKLHCTIYSKGGDFFIKDNNSTNGIFIDSEKITEQKIDDGQIIHLGKKGTVKFVFHKRS